jgi:hypothetical protein
VVRAVGIALALAATLGAVPAAATGLEEARQRRGELAQERAALGADLDLLTASRVEVVAALDALQAHAVAEQAALASADREAADAFRAAGEARVAESRIAVALGARTAQLRDLAVEAYIGDPGALGHLSAIVHAEDAGNAAKAVFLVDLEVERQDAIARELVDLKDEREAAREATAAASSAAEALREEVALRVVAVEEARDQQAVFVAAVEERLERRLAEAAGLEALDAQLAADIVEGERLLAERLAAEAAVRAADAAMRAAEERARAVGDGDDGATAAMPGRRAAGWWPSGASWSTPPWPRAWPPCWQRRRWTASTSPAAASVTGPRRSPGGWTTAGRPPTTSTSAPPRRAPRRPPARATPCTSVASPSTSPTGAR